MPDCRCRHFCFHCLSLVGTGRVVVVGHCGLEVAMPGGPHYHLLVNPPFDGEAAECRAEARPAVYGDSPLDSIAVLFRHFYFVYYVSVLGIETNEGVPG